MNSIILSIKPKWWELIKSGKKTIELRRVVPNQEFDKILFYCSSPVQRLVGVAKVGNIEDYVGYRDPSKRAWFEFWEQKHCVTWEEFTEYNPKHAIHIKLEHVFKTPQILYNRAPQLFMYIDPERIQVCVEHGMEENGQEWQIVF